MVPKPSAPAVPVVGVPLARQAGALLVQVAQLLARFLYFVDRCVAESLPLVWMLVIGRRVRAVEAPQCMLGVVECTVICTADG